MVSHDSNMFAPSRKLSNHSNMLFLFSPQREMVQSGACCGKCEHPRQRCEWVGEGQLNTGAELPREHAQRLEGMSPVEAELSLFRAVP